AGNQGTCNIVASGVAVYIEHFPREIEPFNQPAFHRLWCNLLQADPAACDKGLFYGLRTVDGESEAFEEIDDRVEVTCTDMVSADSAINVEVFEHEQCKPFLKLSFQYVFEGSVPVAGNFPGEPLPQFPGTHVRIEIYRHGYFFLLL